MKKTYIPKGHKPKDCKCKYCKGTIPAVKQITLRIEVIR